MKKHPYLRYTLYMALFLVCYIVGAVLMFPLAYAFRGFARREKFMPLWIWLDDSEPTMLENDYGANWWREEKDIVLEGKNWLQLFFISYRWAALRNPHYNLKLLLKPQQGEIIGYTIKALEGDANPMTFRNKTIFGLQWTEYSINGYEYFRYSFTKRLFKNIYLNFMSGTSSIRYIFKIRVFNIS